MARTLKPVTITPAKGGRLMSAFDPGDAGLNNYVQKVNFRRVGFNEVLREGDVNFAPDGNEANTAEFRLPSDVYGVWDLARPNGEHALVCATKTEIFRYNPTAHSWGLIGSGFSSAAKGWHGEQMNGYLILNNGVDLMVTYRVEDSAVQPIYEMREMGIASVGAFCVYNGFLLVADITEIQSTEMVDWMNGLTPYGIVPDNLTNRIRYKIAWSDYGNPRNWAVQLTGTISEAEKDKVVLEFPIQSFPVGTKLAVVGAGPSGGTLGGQVGIDDGVPVVGVSGATITLSVQADPSLDFPLTVRVLRFADTSSFCGSSSIQDDGSAILRLKPLKGTLIVYRETSIFTGRYTAVRETPFVFRTLYYGRNVPRFPDAVAELNGDVHVYPTQDRFYQFDGTSNPEVFAPLDDARTSFFAGISSSNSWMVSAAVNLLSQELWFFGPNGVLAFDYIQNSCSTIDATYSRGVFARDPGEGLRSTSSSFFFLVSDGRDLVRTATDNAGLSVWTRRGNLYQGLIVFGLGEVSDDFDEKDLLSFVPMFAFDGAPRPVSWELSGCDNLGQTPEVLLTFVVDDPAAQPLVETFYRNIYYADRLSVSSGSRAEFNGRTFVFQLIDSRSATRMRP